MTRQTPPRRRLATAAALGLAAVDAGAGAVIALTPAATDLAPAGTETPAPSASSAPTASSVPPLLEWSTIRSEEGAFTVAMPGVPRQQEGQVNSKFGSSTMHALMWNDKEDLFVAAWDDLAESTDAAVDASVAVERARDGLLRKAAAKLVSDRDIRVGGFLGRDFVAEVHHGGEVVLHGRVVLAGHRMYELMALTPKSESRDADVEHFLGSIVLLPR